MRTSDRSRWRGFGSMMRRQRFGLALVALGCAYLAYPYVTLYRLGYAMQHGDVKFVTAAIDWNSVRAGIAQDVTDTMIGRKSAQPVVATPAPDELPAFGASFASSVAQTAINEELTPDVFAASLSTVGPAGDPTHSDLDGTRLSWAFFSSPTSFMADLKTQDGAPVKLRMELRGTNWMLTRAWLPPEMLADHHT